jgi:hypothetical protein
MFVLFYIYLLIYNIDLFNDAVRISYDMNERVINGC